VACTTCELGAEGVAFVRGAGGRLFWLVQLRHGDRWDLGTGIERRHAGALVLRFVIVCGGREAVANGRSRVSADDVEGVGAYAGRGGARDGDDAVGVAKVAGDDGVAVGAAAVVVADDGVGAGGASNVVRNAAAAAVGGVGVEGAGDIEDEAAPAVAVVVIGVGADGVDVESVGAFAGGEGTGGDDEAGGVVTCDAVGVGVERAGGVGEAGGIAVVAAVVAIEDVGGTVDVAFTAGGGTGVEGAERAVAVAGAAFDDGVGVVQGAGSVGDVGVVARGALAVAPFDVDVGGIKLAGAVSRVKAAVAV